MIDSYKFGEIVIDGQIYSSDLIIFPGRVDASWWRAKGHELAEVDLESVLADPPEVLVVGTGRYGRLSVLPDTERVLTEHGVQLVAQPTKVACQMYNEQVQAGKRTIAALHLTC